MPLELSDPVLDRERLREIIPEWKGNASKARDWIDEETFAEIRS
ncbi:hypothetical protein [Hoeflea poritis]|uniref:Uncharacterized protein n=1 Tax=Hoeflea poritis TaxID=2993659 RepID=A0ABT4VTW0_9HYPH|nr:hypothetical protein [Hoeflea poritis]MDA4847418.1 hypothetical protein [Hoeflea poritis]